MIGRTACLVAALLLCVALAAGPASADSPFLRHGRALDEQKPPLPTRLKRRYQHAIDRMAGQTCILPDKNGAPDRLDWELAQNAIGMEVCLFKAADFLRDGNALIRILRNSGFGAPYVVKQPAIVARHSGIKGDSEVITASMAVSELPNGFGGVFEKLLAYGFSAGIELDTSGRVYHSSATYSRK